MNNGKMRGKDQSPFPVYAAVLEQSKACQERPPYSLERKNLLSDKSRPVATYLGTKNETPNFETIPVCLALGAEGITRKLIL